MKYNVAGYLFLTCILILSGCVLSSNITNSNDNTKGGLFLAKGEMVCQEVLTNKMWQFSKEGPFSSFEEADRYVTELRLGGYDDWRLPTRSELFDLFLLHYWENDGNCVMNHKGEIWAVNRDQKSSLGHWEDDLLCGPEFKYVNSIKKYGYVRAIRP